MVSFSPNRRNGVFLIRWSNGSFLPDFGTLQFSFSITLATKHRHYIVSAMSFHRYAQFEHDVSGRGIMSHFRDMICRMSTV